MQINILTAKRSEESLIFLTPLFVNKSLLRDAGLEVRICYEESDRLYDAECVFIESRVFRRWGREHQDEKAYALFERLRRRVDRVYWLDTTDGTGTTQFQLLPQLDGYFKAQLLRDKAQYTRRHYGGRIYTDYYRSQHGVIDSDESRFPIPADASELAKVQLAWNDGLGDFGRWGRYVRRLREYLPVPLFYSASFAEPGERSLDVSSRFGTNYRRETVAFHREMVARTVNRIGIPNERVARSQYLRELRDAKVAVSPFGWGEPSYKDYEIIISGAMLLKPDMSHMTTWPDLYVSGETYLGFRWDCTDFSRAVDEALSGDNWRRISRQAQSVYRTCLYEREGREQFCRRFQEMARFESSSVAAATQEHQAERLPH